MQGFIFTAILGLNVALEVVSYLVTVNVSCTSSRVVIALLVKVCSYFAFTTKTSTSISESRRSILAG